MSTFGPHGSYVWDYGSGQLHGSWSSTGPGSIRIRFPSGASRNDQVTLLADGKVHIHNVGGIHPRGIPYPEGEKADGFTC
jgi:hypothetical protein